MAKGYWVSVYRTIADPERLAAYDRLAGPAVRAAGAGGCSPATAGASHTTPESPSAPS